MGATVEKTKLNFKDVVTEVDRNCQEVISQTILEVFPEHRILGEEDVDPGAEEAAKAIGEAVAGSGWVWVLDPVDGTTNLANSIPLVTCSIALVKDGEVHAGVVFDPARSEMFSAVRGVGAWLGDEPLPRGQDKAVPSLTLQEAVVCIGCPPEPTAFKRSVATLETLGPRVRGMRMFSSAALIYSWVALGRITGYVAYNINLWDFAAGKLILEEAGGVATDMSGSPLQLTDRDTLCSTRGIHAELVEVVSKVN